MRIWFIGIPLLTSKSKKALAQTPEIDQAKLNVELSNMNIISGCDMARTLLGDHPADSGAESVLLKCDQAISLVKHDCDAHPEYGLKTCSDPRIAQYMAARGLQ